MPTMWDRLRTAPQKQGGPPSDGKHAYHQGLNANINSGNRGQYSYSIKGGPAPPRPPREFVESQYETVPPVQDPPPRNPNRHNNTNDWRDSSFRPVSSVYSQSSPVTQHFPVTASLRINTQHAGTTLDISPPSSPEPEYSSSGVYAPKPPSPDVSPIDEDVPDMSQLAAGSSRAGRAEPGPQNAEQGSNRTNIPMMRRARRKQSDAALREAHSRERMGNQQLAQANDRKGGDVRWDPMTGEITNSSRGKPSQVNPAEYAQGLGISGPAAPAQSGPRSPSAIAASFGDRVRMMAQQARPNKKAGPADNSTDPAAGAFTSSRPGWRGASGRTTLVDPVKDTKTVAPLKIPQKSSRRVVSPSSATAPNPPQALGRSPRGQTPPVSPLSSETATGSGPRDTIRQVVPSSQLSPSATKPQPTGGQSYPSPPLSGSLVGTEAPPVAAKQRRPVGGGSTDLNTQSAQSPTGAGFADAQDRQSIKRKPPPSHANHQHQESVSSVYSQQSEAPPPPPPHNPNPTYLTPNDPWVQPASRFSVTTYATSAAATPRESLDDFDHDRPPVPPPPRQYQQSPESKQDSVMDRRRPKLNSGGGDNGYSPGSSPIVISLKDPYMSSPSYGGTSQAAKDRRAAAMGGGPTYGVSRARTDVERPVSVASSINKSLPMAPPETNAEESHDRVAILNAQLQALGNRRININRSIKQMTELMPTDNLMASAEVIHKREMEKRKVETLKTELADVQREEYELGLKLHRSYKRMDRDAEWEPTTLWVRRVTG